MLRIAQISDLHFSKLTYSLSQFLSKQWVGNFNLFAFRKKNYIPDNINLLPEIFKDLNVQYVVVCGDVSTTSQRSEFALASHFIQHLAANDATPIVVPGNHDQYTKKAYKQKWFYDFFPSSFSSPIKKFNLKEHGVAAKFLGDQWWIVTLDTALATPLISSRGYFSPFIEFNLEELLLQIPPQDSVILVNHFPFFQNDSSRKILLRGAELQAVIRKFPKIKFYLHGHSHRHCIADLRMDGLPVILDSGSTAHRTDGTWNLIDITHNGNSVTAYAWQTDKWVPHKKVSL
ncbi:MAG: metallophosphoesterase [Rhabdochlamydiaceae bacterium]|jgi:3',5'-cyclic AMP phosphodiesterase CpdA